MKPGVVLINTSRGALVDAEAVIEGLKNNIIGAAAMDVYENESSYFFNDLSDQVMSGICGQFVNAYSFSGDN